MISRNTDLSSIHDFMFHVNMVIDTGSNNAIYTSKIMKISAIKKIVMRMTVVQSSFWVKSTYEWGFYFLSSCFSLRFKLL
jgi:hypothetical protein